MLCIVFGVVSDIITKNMYSESQQKKQQLPPIEEEKSKEVIELIDTNFEKDEAPPPLPEKDYNNDKGIDSLASKLEALAASNNQNDDSDSNDDDDDKQLEPPRQYNRTVSDEYNQNTSNVNYNNSESIIEEETTAASNDLAEDEDDDSDESVNARKVYAKARMFNFSSNHLIITSVI